MVAITVGTGATFKSGTAEGHLLEISTYLQIQEKNLASNSTGKDFIQVTYNLNDMVTGISFSIPADQSIGSSGQILTNASDYLQGITFTPGSGGTFKSTTLSQYFLEVITYLQIKENANASNPQLVNNISSSYAGDEKLVSGTISLPILVSFDDTGHPIISAIEYLL
ncbi:hypothetical protein [Nostoc sp. CHAB 5715]|uniref:hypothetical protein n=1 Tax=Nostoc sp. CHAB 5715 TaxID=2780400 RepID=UPI001E2F4952|nr:hypothetical protein [Nostoc sp. CHAB 5715]MCC5620715.1 hypothetical protein [Nostoc sp. CHAB 5715]